jgi:ABC-2 type transport system permease protein
VNAPSVLARLSGAARREAGFIVTSRAMLMALVVVPLCAIAIIAAMLSQGALQALPVGVVDNARTSESQALVRLLSGRPEVRIAAQPVSDTAAEAAMRRGEIWAFVSIPRHFGQPGGADEPIRLYYNAAYLSVGSTVERSLATALRGSIITGLKDNAWRAGVLSDRVAIPQVQISVLFNPQASFEWFLQALIQPAMLHLLAACVGVYAMARELGGADGRSLDAWRAETGGGVAALAGKLAPYLTVLSFWGAVWMVWLMGFKGWRMEGSLLATFAAQLA